MSSRTASTRSVLSGSPTDKSPVCGDGIDTLPLSATTYAAPRATRVGYLLPVNTTSGGLCCTLNTRYEAMSLPLDILSLAHYPKTVLLCEYFL